MSPLKAVIFDLDGVITKTARVHAAAWKTAFDAFLRKRGGSFKEFTQQDYIDYVDGKPREEGIKSFLKTRGVELPLGDKEDGPDRDTIYGLGNRKNLIFKEILERDGVETYTTTVELIKDLRSRGIRVAVASSSKNCQPILQRTGLEKYFEARVDGVVSQQLGLKGKPEGDIFIKAAEMVEAKPAESVVVEDAISGVQAGRNGKFALVIGVARHKNEEELRRYGADVVVTDFKDIDVEDLIEWFQQKNGS